MYRCKACRHHRTIYGDGRSPCCDSTLEPVPEDRSFEFAVLIAAALAAALSYVALREIPGAPLNLLHRVRALKGARPARECACHP